ncbi:alpha/beta fold hydrolase [Agromyces sp. NPDC058126]|uniref:alpha/beta fold hydrolase n=1 Tax=Agromyces sp. NPDC058126 TaxID=3346350 RepID=UPI0036DB9BC0
MNAPWTRQFDLPTAAGSIRVREWGDPDGPLVVFHHGTPSSSIAVPGGWAGPATAGVRLCSYDRPGYGGSPSTPGRTVADAAEWSRLIADACGADRFAVLGTSGGGPHAVATAALLPERVTALCVDVGLGPAGFGSGGSRWSEPGVSESGPVGLGAAGRGPAGPGSTGPGSTGFASGGFRQAGFGFDGATGMVAETVAEITAARRGEGALREHLSSLGDGADALEEWFARLPPSDREVLGRPEVQHEEAVEATEWGVHGIDGWVDDDLALFAREWAFDPSRVRAATRLVYGGADVLVPASHGQAWLALLPHAELQVVPDGGHWMRDHEVELLRWCGAAVAV